MKVVFPLYAPVALVGLAFLFPGTKRAIPLAVTLYGWVGSILVLLAYALIAAKRIDFIHYQILNVVGSIGIALEAYWKKVRSVVFLNVIWALIGISIIVWRCF